MPSFYLPDGSDTERDAEGVQKGIRNFLEELQPTMTKLVVGDIFLPVWSGSMDPKIAQHLGSLHIRYLKGKPNFLSHGLGSFQVDERADARPLNKRPHPLFAVPFLQIQQPTSGRALSISDTPNTPLLHPRRNPTRRNAPLHLLPLRRTPPHPARNCARMGEPVGEARCVPGHSRYGHIQRRCRSGNGVRNGEGFEVSAVSGYVSVR